MATKNIEIQDHQGNIYHPHTDAKVVFTSDGKTVEEKLESLKQSANSGKQIIANAVGSPLVNSDTFSGMGSKIDKLTQTFRNNLNTKGVNTTNADKMSTLVGKVGEIKLGKKWASGDNVKLSSSKQSFTTSSNTVSAYYLEVNNLDFIPSIILVFGQNDNALNFSGTSYYPYNDNYIGTFYANSVHDMSSYYGFMKTGFNIGKNKGFLVPVSSWNSGTYKWIAYE